jgi:hypothetical protein
MANIIYQLERYSHLMEGFAIWTIMKLRDQGIQQNKASNIGKQDIQVKVDAVKDKI